MGRCNSCSSTTRPHSQRERFFAFAILMSWPCVNLIENYPHFCTDVTFLKAFWSYLFSINCSFLNVSLPLLLVAFWSSTWILVEIQPCKKWVVFIFSGYFSSSFKLLHCSSFCIVPKAFTTAIKCFKTFLCALKRMSDNNFYINIFLIFMFLGSEIHLPFN